MNRRDDDNGLIYIFRMPIDRRLAIATALMLTLLLALLAATFFLLRPPTDSSTLADVTPPTPIIRPTPTSTEVAVTTPTLELVPSPSPMITGLAVGSTVEIVNVPEGLNVREAPNTDATVIARLNNGARLRIIGGPTEQGGYTWWQVEGHDFKGWCVQNFLQPVQ